MKSVLLSSLVFVLVLALLGACGEGPATEPAPTLTSEPTEPPPTVAPTAVSRPVGELVIYDGEGAFALEYPAAWQVVERASANAVLFVTPQTAGGDLFRENVGVTHQEITDEGITLEAYTNEFLALAPEAVADYELVSSEATTLSGLPAHRVLYAGSQDGVPLQWLQVWTLSGGRAYILTYTADPAEFETFLDEVNYIIASFALQ